jgi:hypothetical protein
VRSRRRLILVAARLGYVLITGVALVAALQHADYLKTVGSYTYQIGFAGAAAAILACGADRVLARRIAAKEIPARYPRSLLMFRIALAGATLLVAVPIGIAIGHTAIIASCITFVIARVIYADIEAMWIASDSGDAYLAAALTVNGIITAVGIYAGAAVSAPFMVAVSALGNVIALLVLLSSRRVRTASFALPEFVSESRGTGLSSVLAVIYQRADLALLASATTPLSSVGLYGLVTRVFDALTVARGAIAQQETRDLAGLTHDRRVSRLADWAPRIQLVALALSGAALIGIVVAQTTTLFSDAQQQWLLLALAAAVLPLFFSHTPTVALVFADRRTNLLLAGSVVACVASTGVRAVLIHVWGLSGATVGIAAAEYISCLTFFLLYARASPFRAKARVLGYPLAAAAVAAALLLVSRPLTNAY